MLLHERNENDYILTAIIGFYLNVITSISFFRLMFYVSLSNSESHLSNTIMISHLKDEMQ